MVCYHVLPDNLSTFAFVSQFQTEHGSRWLRGPEMCFFIWWIIPAELCGHHSSCLIFKSNIHIDPAKWIQLQGVKKYAFPWNNWLTWGKIYRKPMIFTWNMRFSCIFSLKPINWLIHQKQWLLAVQAWGIVGTEATTRVFSSDRISSIEMKNVMVNKTTRS